MLHPSTKKLIDRLAAMTAQKKIDWIEKDNGDVLYATEGYVVRLTPEPPRVLLSTEGGKALEDATATVLTATPHDDGGTYGTLVATLARDACRDARGTESAISTLLAGLSETPEPEAPEEVSQDQPETVEADTAAIPIGPDAVEDPVDDTTAIETAKPAAPEQQAGIAIEAEAPVEEAVPVEAEAAGGTVTEPDTPAAPVLDESVPEPAIAEIADLSEEPAEDAASEPPAAEIADIEPLDPADGDDDDDSEAFVGGAVARLADEVNMRTPEPMHADSAVEPDAAIGDDASDQDETIIAAQDASQTEGPDVPLSPSYSIPPDDAPPISGEPDEIAPEAAAPLPEEPVETAAPEESGAAPSEGIGTDDTIIEDATGGDDLAAAAPSEVWDETRTDGSQTADTMTEDVQPEPETPAALGEQTGSGSDDGQADEPATDPAPVAAAEEHEPASASNVRYVPFGAGGLETAGADVSGDMAQESRTEDDVIDSGLAAAAPSMSLPDDAPEETAPLDDTPLAEAEPEEKEEAPEAEEPTPAPASAAPSADTASEPAPMTAAEPAPEPAQEAPEPDTEPPETKADASSTPDGSFSLSSLSAGLGFGGTASGFQPTAPRPAGISQPAQETVSRAPVFIDATDDFPGDTAPEDASEMPDISDLADTEHAVEATVSESDLAAVAPPQPQAATTAQEPDRALSLVENDAESDQETGNATEERRPSRPKTRFNPWT